MTQETTRRLTISGQYGDWRIAGSRWNVDDAGKLTVFAQGQAAAVAEFCPGQWTAIIDEQHRDPDRLSIARQALLDIQAAIRAMPLSALSYEDSDNPLVQLARRIADIAEQARAATYDDQPPF